MGQRYDNRKNKRANRMLNVAITAVVVLILFFGGTLIYNIATSSDSQTAQDAQEEQTDPAVNESEESNSEEEQDNNEQTSDDQQSSDETTDEAAVNEDDEDDASNEDEGSEETVAQEGDILPTNQTNPNPNDFRTASENWAEMENALYLATGLNSSNSYIEWLGNGGSTTSAVGILGENSTGHYHQVRLQWVENEGWRIESVSEHQTNPR